MAILKVGKVGPCGSTNRLPPNLEEGWTAGRQRFSGAVVCREAADPLTGNSEEVNPIANLQ